MTVKEAIKLLEKFDPEEILYMGGTSNYDEPICFEVKDIYNCGPQAVEMFRNKIIVDG